MYVATINTPGSEPTQRQDHFELIEDAWLWLAEQRERHEEDADCSHSTCEDVVKTLAAQQVCGRVHAHRPSMILPRGSDLGLYYSVDPMLCDHDWVGGMIIIHPEDLAQVAASGREINCTRCDQVYQAK